MKKYSLDTHVALWLFNEHENLPKAIKSIIINGTNLLYISIISAWEIAIKNSIGKLSEFNGRITLFIDTVQKSPIEFISVSE